MTLGNGDPIEPSLIIRKFYRLLKLMFIISTFSAATSVFVMQMLKYYFVGSRTLK